MAEKNIVENRPAEDIKERFSSNETVNTVMNGLGKVVDYHPGCCLIHTICRTAHSCTGRFHTRFSCV